ncbi:LytR/AlgR family response regulator transcription factor [Loigolactobacillus binensis]|uniref:LytR/AlgR family response regulator transcription factor n=1 Tax=Loigolactobacillus binensis TaxID=2559922 RepID=A0ABW3EHG7_9LACO|nr:LytTR family DNA-binding domain-containing protein [Loigolactobacillus binensis]
MLNIIICEDNLELLRTYKVFVKSYLNTHTERQAQLVLATANPNKVAQFLTGNATEPTLYILDIEFANSLTTGITLATKIKHIDTKAKIIFITTHEELLPLIVKNKIVPLAIIEKETGLQQVKNELLVNLDKATTLTTKKIIESDYFVYKIGSKAYKIAKDEIFYFKASTNSHKILIFTAKTVHEFHGNLTAIESANTDFYRVHNSYLVNLKKIKKLDTTNLELILINNQLIPVATRKITGLIKTIKAD